MMTFDELVSELLKAYREAPRGEQTASIVLFGIKYADDLRRVNVADIQREVAKQTKRNRFDAEINCGIQLAKYVELK